MKIATTKERILEYADFKGISKSQLYRDTGLKRGVLDADKLHTSISDVYIANIIAVYSDINLEWLMTGNGTMLLSEQEASQELQGSIKGVPFYNLPVSAGHSTLDIIGATHPEGYINNLPGADIAEAILPVTGMSMLPEIMPGALIGVRLVHNWESLNTERIYMIITQEDRMIKRIEHDSESDDAIWCVSPNYQKFKVYKSQIIEIHRVCFVYNTI